MTAHEYISTRNSAAMLSGAIISKFTWKICNTVLKLIAHDMKTSQAKWRDGVLPWGYLGDNFFFKKCVYTEIVSLQNVFKMNNIQHEEMSAYNICIRIDGYIAVKCVRWYILTTMHLRYTKQKVS